MSTDEWRASITFTRNIDEFVGAICGYPNIFHGQPTNPTPRLKGLVDPGSEEWWRRAIAASQREPARQGVLLQGKRIGKDQA